MSVNASSFTSDFYPDVSFRNSSFPVYMRCFLSRPSAFVFTAFTVTSFLLLLPLSIFTFYTALQQCQQKSAPSWTASLRHSDYFVHNMVVMEMIGVNGCVLCCFGIYSHCLPVVHVGSLLFSFSWYGQAISHILTCVERYLATVHPITYLSLKNERGARIRNISIVSNWLLAFLGMSLVMFDNLFIVMDFAVLMVSFTLIFFCSLSVLRVLILPGPGMQPGEKKKVDRLKQRAFFNILITLGVLMLRFLLNLFWVVLLLSGSSGCLILMCCAFSSLPSSLVLPLLFLRKEGQLVCRNKNIQPGPDLIK